MNSVLVGMFDTQAAATQARAKLLSAGFSADSVSMTGGTMSSSTASTPGSEAPPQEGAISRFFSGIFGDDSDDRADSGRAGYTDTYNEAFKRGGYGVSVSAGSDDEMDEAAVILNDCGAVDIDEKADSWRKEGWSGATGGGMATGTGTVTTLQDGATRKLQEVEEELKVGKRAVARGGVRVFTRMTEVPVSETVSLREEHASVQRKAVDRPATEADFAAFKEGAIEVREMAEEAVVSKTARVTGEVEVGKTATEREETISDTVRKTHVDVEQIAGDQPSARSSAGMGTTGMGSTAMGSTGMGSTTMGSTDMGSANRDPITGAPGAHPVGTGVGAAAGGMAAGAAIGTVAGPVGTAVGAAVGAVAGGLAGKGVAETMDPTTSTAKPKPGV